MDLTHKPPEGATKHLYSISDLDRREIMDILDLGEELQRCRAATVESLAGKVIGLMFFQSSTRTRIGFHVAAARLGATAVHLETMRYDVSMSEAEDPVDAFRCISSYFDLVVLRHADEQGFRRMLATSPVAVINGGCGMRHHPTQTLVDLFTVRTRMGRLDGLRWGIAGDLARSRTARSLIEALEGFEVEELRLMAPPASRPPIEASFDFKRKLRYLDRLDPSGLDVLYMAGYPSRAGRHSESTEDRARFQLTAERALMLPRGAAVLCPLPRIDEIERAVDGFEQAAYFEQSRKGLFVRMALLERTLSPASSGRHPVSHRS